MGGRTAIKRRFNWRAAAGYAFAIAAIVWVFHDIDLRNIAQQFRVIRFWWILPAIACDVLSYVCEGERWRLLLKPVGDLPLIRAVQATYAGLFTNEVMPLRFGEFVRAYLASRWMGAPVSALIPSLAVGRLIDSVFLAAGVGVLLILVPLPAGLAKAGEIFGITIATLLLIFVTLSARPPSWARRWCGPSRSRMCSLLGRVVVGVSQVGLNRNLVISGLFSLALLLLQAAAFWFMMAACRLPLRYVAACAVFLIVHLGTAIPNAPGNVGSFQLFTVIGLQLFGIDKPAAAGFSVILFLVLTLPLLALGLFAISRRSITLHQIRSDLSRTMPAPTGAASGPAQFHRVERIWSERPF